MPRKRKNRRESDKARAIASGRPPRGLAAQYAEKQARRDQRRAEEAARLQAETGCGWAFGARAESQLLALARFLAAWAEFEAENPKGPTGEDLARRRNQALLRQVRMARQTGLIVTLTDFGDDVTVKAGEFALDRLPAQGFWEPCQWEPGRIDLEGLGLYPGEGLSIANVAGDIRRQFGERSREIRWYHARGQDQDPSGAPYSRLAIGQNLPLPALKRTLSLLVQKYGNDPIAWPGFKAEAAQYRPDISGEPVPA